ncbi:MAG: Wzz/FepE/Etk N-terminal domain-containing protein [Patescibacteria group bacterium]|nr:Wzz/FepE/Etk N-terminal domain-containing protein [Patescibacteria group bacterium]
MNEYKQEQNNISDIDADEIDLMDYVKIIFKRKYLIFGIFFLSMLCAGVFSFFMPKVYEINTMIEIGGIKNEKTQKIEIIEQPTQLVEKINSDVYGVEIRNKLQISEAEYAKIKIENSKNTNLVKLTIKSSDIEKSKNILQGINGLILAEHQEIIENKKQLLEKDIELLEKDIEVYQQNEQRIKNKISFLKQEQVVLENKISALQKVLVYEQTPGTQFALFDNQEKLQQKKQEIENRYLEISSLNVKINSFQNSVNSILNQIKNIQKTKIIKNISVSENPVSPRILLNIIIAGILGMFIAVFLAFFKEWWEKER